MSRNYYANSRSQAADNQDALIRMRCILKNQLKQAQLPNMPAGFPFHFVANGQGSAFLSQGPYEFPQEICTSAYGGYAQSQTAIFSFTDPATSLRSRGCDKYVWRISLPIVEAGQHPDSRVVVAEVQVDTSVMRSKYGDQYLGKDPRIICNTLAMALEYGVKVTIALADDDLITAFQLRGMKRPASVGDIIFIGINQNGQHQILNILDGRGYYVKFSASP
ncbi:hypothetical protein EST38_g6755 [Candolleomyces aberdarensis]|uniref:Uncharacterized protein n=1 Tax=Candolleomyces aberdarensis TaxID=2316362 RepID=A0A4V1Q3M4_9AGAR|nr:hypothetical protein EST38_g6755 [Candolleomyces aberdarensis]